MSVRNQFLSLMPLSLLSLLVIVVTDAIDVIIVVIVFVVVIVVIDVIAVDCHYYQLPSTQKKYKINKQQQKQPTTTNIK